MGTAPRPHTYAEQARTHHLREVAVAHERSAALFFEQEGELFFVFVVQADPCFSAVEEQLKPALGPGWFQGNQAVQCQKEVIGCLLSGHLRNLCNGIAILRLQAIEPLATHDHFRIGTPPGWFEQSVDRSLCGRLANRNFDSLDKLPSVHFTTASVCLCVEFDPLTDV
jgi:hypothetical protein